MKKLAIVSSYRELCGNATYTDALKRGFSEFYEVEVIELNVPLLKSLARGTQAAAEAHIQEIAKRLTSYDYVNLQFEYALYGSRAKDIYRRLACLMKSSKNCILTLHRFDPPKANFSRKLIKKMVEFKLFSCLQEILENFRYNHYAKLQSKVIAEAKKRGVGLVVHTKREKASIQSLYGITKIADHPISFLTRAQVAQYQKNRSPLAFRKKYDLGEEDILVGIFGFISQHKGHDTAVRAMACLPDQYKLLIFGGQHPFYILPQTPVEPFIASLLELIQEKSQETSGFYERIRFLGSVSDEDFIEALLHCDVTILPYLETNQSGSGIAALTLDLGSKAIFSMNYAFLELAKYAPEVFPVFSIGNYLELAQAIQRQYKAAFNPVAYEQYWQHYNLSSSIQVYRRMFEPNIL